MSRSVPRLALVAYAGQSGVIEDRRNTTMPNLWRGAADRRVGRRRVDRRRADAPRCHTVIGAPNPALARTGVTALFGNNRRTAWPARCGKDDKARCSLGVVALSFSGTVCAATLFFSARSFPTSGRLAARPPKGPEGPQRGSPPSFPIEDGRYRRAVT